MLSADYPGSDKTDKPLAWAHNYGKARVFGYQSGHSATVWANKSFQSVFGQGVRWAAGCPEGTKGGDQGPPRK